MKTYNLKPFYSTEEAKKKAGDWVTDDDYDILIKSDCDAYDEKGNPLFFFRKNKIPTSLCKIAYKTLRDAATTTKNRGAASGAITDETRATMDVATESKTRLRLRKKDGTLSNTNLANTVNSGVVGYFDRNPRFPFCRQTAWMDKNFHQYKKAYPYIKYIDKLFEESCPEKYKAQKKMAEKTNADFVIKNTCFTTITVNKNFRTALHVDSGDFKGGLGNLAVLQAGNYDGGYTVLPRYRVAFDVRSGDVCFFNVHEHHANTEIKAKLAYERISVVCYYREKMHNCLDAKSELSRAKKRLKGENLQ